MASLFASLMFACFLNHSSCLYKYAWGGNISRNDTFLAFWNLSDLFLPIAGFGTFPNEKCYLICRLYIKLFQIFWWWLWPHSLFYKLEEFQEDREIVIIRTVLFNYQRSRFNQSEFYVVLIVKSSDEECFSRERFTEPRTQKKAGSQDSHHASKN